MSDEDHFTRLRRLLELETRAQVEEALERRRLGGAERAGEALSRLRLSGEDAIVGGYTQLTFTGRDPKSRLPWSRLRPGAPVRLTPEIPGVTRAGGSSPGWNGVVSRLDRDRVQVAFHEYPELPEEANEFRLDLANDEAATKRQRYALEDVRQAKTGRLAELRLRLVDPSQAKLEPRRGVTPEGDLGHLDATQADAVRLALAAPDLAIVHGPPGTGKTTTLVELIRQAVRRGEKVLATAPSNLAVDNLLERLVAKKTPVLRMGHPSRVLPELLEHTLDARAERHPEMRTVMRMRKEADELRARARRYTRTPPPPGERARLYREARAILEDARRMERHVLQRLIAETPVIGATLTGISGELLGDLTFDLAVIDEASQTTEPPCWIAIKRSGRLVLAGDHRQLPPTVLSREAAAEGYSRSMMERLMETKGIATSALSRRLGIQYRMHEDIARFSSSEFYEGSLEPAPSVRHHLLQDLPGVQPTAFTTAPVHFIDTAGAGLDEKKEEDGVSTANPGEADLVARFARELMDSGVPAADIAVITPYAAQVRLLETLLADTGLEIDTVDGFQGREKEAVLISLVRSNAEGEVGFLEDTRRTNVALTRARRCLIVVGDSATIAAHPFYERLVSYLQEIGAYRSAWEFV